MEEYNMTCENCGKEFRVKVTTMNVSGGKEKEKFIALIAVPRKDIE